MEQRVSRNLPSAQLMSQGWRGWRGGAVERGRVAYISVGSARYEALDVAMPPLARALPLRPPLPRAPRPVARCLFGAPSPAETRRLADEAFAGDRERFMERWGLTAQELSSLSGPCETKSPVESSPDAERFTFWKDTTRGEMTQSKDSFNKRRHMHRHGLGPYSRQSTMKDFFPCCRGVVPRSAEASTT